ncbi:MAG TPA: sigma-70 family RNA polymerase sigma factor [Pseudonocardiaceae bacterium]|jgi:RNA polymerase primary sigma factor/RNA polymerase nonessential primary-like sigma factor|nr:sigma-70 family RNA polymerase sigma factor [Pseudonocardiaceae bacterium]
MSVSSKTATRRARNEDLDPVRSYLDGIGATPLLTAEQEVELARRIEAGVYATELLRRDETGEAAVDEKRRRDLVLVAADGARARDHMIRANLRLVVSVAKKHAHTGLPLLDVIQEGNLGLIHAVEKFDYTKGFKFSTYATWWIRQAIDRGLATQIRTIRLPVHVVGELARFSRVERNLALRLEREPTVVELAAAARTSVDQVVELRRSAREVISLDTPVGAGDTLIGELIEDTEGPSADEVVEHQALGDELRALVHALPQREALIISLRFGLVDGHEHTLQQIADRLGYTRERIRQLEKQALAELRDPARNHRLSVWAA